MRNARRIFTVLTHLKDVQKRVVLRRKKTHIVWSRDIQNLLHLLKNYGYIHDYWRTKFAGRQYLTVEFAAQPEFYRSRPPYKLWVYGILNRSQNVGIKDLTRLASSPSTVYILLTSYGILSGTEAAAQKVGGIVVCALIV